MRPRSKNPVEDPSEADAGIDISIIDQLVEVGQSRTVAHLVQQIANRTATSV